MHPFVLFEIGPARGQIDVACRTKLACRLKDIGFLTIIQVDLLHVIQRVLTQVDLSVLGISQLHAIIVDRCVLATHRADIDRLDAAYAAVVFELHAREIAERIGYIERAESF